jgi:hypothetical protein
VWWHKSLTAPDAALAGPDTRGPQPPVLGPAQHHLRHVAVRDDDPLHLARLQHLRNKLLPRDLLPAWLARQQQPQRRQAQDRRQQPAPRVHPRRQRPPTATAAAAATTAAALARLLLLLALLTTAAGTAALLAGG